MESESDMDAGRQLGRLVLAMARPA